MTTQFLTAPSLSAVSANTQLMLVGVFENDFPQDAAAELNTACGGTLLSQARADEFTGKVGQTMLHFPNNMVAASRVMLYGLGKRSDVTVEQLRKALLPVFRKVQKLQQSEVTLARVDLTGTGITPEQLGRTISEVSGLVDYVLNHQKTEKGGHKPETRLSELRVMARLDEADPLKRGMAAGRTVAAAVNAARDLVNLPPGQCTPEFLAEQAKQVAAKSEGRLTCKILYRTDCAQLGMNAFLAVAQGSVQAPYFIEMTYEPENPVSQEILGIVGKSITFDSGGLDLKTADGMRTMKCDMAGGAAVLSAISAIAALKLPVRVKAFMAATENMCSGSAYKPGDVLKTMAGLTVEVDNTDAEGRLTLVDAIEYARRVAGVSKIVDLATLTGAVRTTCGDLASGAFGNDDAWTAQVIKAGASVGERMFAMPMWPELAKANDSDIADLKNSGASYGGAGSSTAALFIGRFAEGLPWVHLDIASVAYRGRELGLDPAGGTGYGVRSLVALVESIAAAAQA